MSTKFALGTLLAFMTVVTAQADAPQPVIIITQVDFTADTGTFTATPPLCPTGIVRPTDLQGVLNPSGHFLGHWEFVLTTIAALSSPKITPTFRAGIRRSHSAGLGQS